MSGPAAVTVEQVRAGKWQLFCHLNMGTAGHKLVYTCSDFPRLSLSTLTVRGKATKILTVDGVEVVDLAAAVQALNSPSRAAVDPAKQLDLGL